jgi:hypothetical protein
VASCSMSSCRARHRSSWLVVSRVGRGVGVVVHCGIAGMVCGTELSSNGGIVAMGMTKITALHALWIGKPELSPSLEAELSSLGNSSRMACNDDDPLWAMPPTTAPESSPSGDGLKLLEWSAVNSRSSKWMASSWVSLMLNKEMSLVATVGLHR